MGAYFRKNINSFRNTESEEQPGFTNIEEARIIRVSRGEVKPKLDSEVCSICGRTILVGETPELYEAPHVADGALVVCSICRPHARESGLSKVA